MRFKILFGVFISFILTATLFVNTYSDRIEKKDAYMNLVSAFNLYQSNTFSIVNPDTAKIFPDMYREPLYPFLLSLGLYLQPKSNQFSATCLTEDPLCENNRKALRILNAFFWFAMTLMIYAWLVFGLGSVFWGMAGVAVFNLFPVLEWSRFTNEVAAAFFLMAHSGALYFTVKNKHSKNRLLIGIGLSFLLGALLVLVKAVFYYWLVLMSLVFVVWLVIDKRRGLNQGLWTTKFAMAALVGTLPLMGWQLRNQIHFGEHSVSDRGGVVLALRAEFLHASKREIQAAFALFFPSRPRIIKKKWMSYFQEEDFRLIDRKNPESYYQRVKARQKTYMELEAAEGRRISYNEEFQNSAKDLILSKPFKHIALSFLFGWRGSFLAIKPGEKLLSYRGYSILRDLFSWIMLMLVPSFILVSLINLMNRNWSVLVAFVPALYSFGIHALATHYIPRYSEPLFPIWLCSLLMLPILISPKKLKSLKLKINKV